MRISKSILAVLLIMAAQPALADQAAKEAAASSFLEALMPPAVREQMINNIIDALEQAFTAQTESLIGMVELANEDQRVVLLNEAEARRVRVVGEIRKLYAEKIDIYELTRRIYAPLYAREFSVEELKQLEAFYRSATGNKFTLSNISLMAEATPQLMEAIMPITQDEAMMIVQREIELFQQDVIGQPGPQ